MKKLGILSLVACATLLFSACQKGNKLNQEDIERDTEKVVGTKTESSQTTVSTSSEIRQEAQTTIAETSEVAAIESNRKWENAYAWSLEQIGSDQTEGHATHYAFYDIDDNGSMELITGHAGSDGQMFLASIYYLKSGVSTYLAESYVRSAGGGRAAAIIFTDGMVSQYFWHSGSGNGEAYLYRLRADNSGHDILDQQSFEQIQFPDYQTGRAEVDIQRFDWHTF